LLGIKAEFVAAAAATVACAANAKLTLPRGLTKQTLRHRFGSPGTSLSKEDHKRVFCEKQRRVRALRSALHCGTLNWRSSRTRSGTKSSGECSSQPGGARTLPHLTAKTRSGATETTKIIGPVPSWERKPPAKSSGTDHLKTNRRKRTKTGSKTPTTSVLSTLGDQAAYSRGAAAALAASHVPPRPVERADGERHWKRSAVRYLIG
jgi:hypothetical protein